MAKKVALLVGVGEYGEGLKALRCPVKGVEAMETVLVNPEIGGFDEVVPLVNPDVGEMRSRMGSLFASLSKDDLVLFYFTGHGIKDMNGKFYLSTTQTELFVNGRVNSGTAVEADFLRSVVGDCLALRKVVILDCCFGAAFADGFMGMDDSSIDVEAQVGAQASNARGWCVLTASTSTQYALEQEDEELSVYTRYLVAGLRTGGAAPDGKEHISVGHLHAYVTAQVKEAAPAMDPAIFNAQQGAEIAIAKAVVDNEQRYRKQVQAKVRRGRIRPAARVYLLQWQQRLKLEPEQAAAIEEEILKPARERQKHMEIYAEALKAEQVHSFPLDNEAIQDLRDLQRFLNLRDADVKSIDNNIPVKQNKAVDTLKAQLEPQDSVPQDLQKEKTATLQYPTFSFDTVCVDEKGLIIETISRKAEYFTEDLRKGVTLDMVHIP
ncbi:MAG: caspase family protein, partial [Cyanobacteria bacterium J06598_3]